MHDELAERLDSLRSTIGEQICHPKGGAETVISIRRLAKTHPLCVEIAFSNAVLDFFIFGFSAGLRSISQVLSSVDKYYSASHFDGIQVTALREMVARRVELKSSEYVEFLFCAYYVRELFVKDDFLYVWIDSEWKKRRKLKQYNELFQLRNMVWSLTRGLASKSRRSSILKTVEAIDNAIVDLLRDKLGTLEKRKRCAELSSVAICCGLLKHDYRSLHATLVFDYARNLLKTFPGLSVSIIVTNEMPFEWAGHRFWMGQMSADFEDGLLTEANRLIEPELRERFRFANMPLANGSWQDLWKPIQWLLDFDPDVLMFYGEKFYNESWFVRKALFNHYPTAYFFSQMNNVVDNENDIYLVRNSHPLRGTYDASRAVVAPPAVRVDALEDGSQFEYSAMEIKRDPEEVTVVTALAGTRMARIFARYDASVRGEMMSLLDVPGVRWIWLGPVDPAEVLKVDPRFASKHAEGKLEIRRFEPHLAALFDKCDLMLHLPRFTGGGGGIMLALKQELPVLCFSNTDSSAYVLPECVFDWRDEAGYFRQARRLVGAPALLPELGRRSAAHYATYNVNGLARLTYGGLQRAARSFNGRISSSVEQL